MGSLISHTQPRRPNHVPPRHIGAPAEAAEETTSPASSSDSVIVAMETKASRTKSNEMSGKDSAAHGEFYDGDREGSVWNAFMDGWGGG